MFRNNPEHTGVYNSAAVAAAPQVKWKFTTHAAGVFLARRGG